MKSFEELATEHSLPLGKPEDETVRGQKWATTYTWSTPGGSHVLKVKIGLTSQTYAEIHLRIRDPELGTFEVYLGYKHIKETIQIVQTIICAHNWEAYKGGSLITFYFGFLCHMIEN